MAAEQGQKISDMIKKEAGVEKGAATKDAAGDLSMDKLVGIARSRKQESLGKSMKEVAKEALGCCKSMGITVDGKDAVSVIREIDEGKHDSLLAGG